MSSGLELQEAAIRVRESQNAFDAFHQSARYMTLMKIGIDNI